jgi:16S rRNA (guanine(966)-N(2))-methyltransferase RsmD
MDRVKEALFNIVGTGVQGASFLDLFAGTGSIGIEALSRGAERVLFIDRDKLAVRTIHENLAITHLAKRAEVLRADAFVYLQRPKPESFEYIYVAPPQYKGMWKEVLLAIDANPAHLVPDGSVIIQIDPGEREEITLQALQIYDERIYGKTLLWFFERPEDGEKPSE